MCLESELAESRSNFDGGMLNCVSTFNFVSKKYIFLAKKTFILSKGWKKKGGVISSRSLPRNYTKLYFSQWLYTASIFILHNLSLTGINLPEIFYAEFQADFMKHLKKPKILHVSDAIPKNNPFFNILPFSFLKRFFEVTKRKFSIFQATLCT